MQALAVDAHVVVHEVSGNIDRRLHAPSRPMTMRAKIGSSFIG